MEFNVDNYLSNLSYINKDFESLWNEILETIPKLTNKWIPSEANESDPLVVLLKELAIIADKLNYNIDKNILELFPATLTQLRSAYNVYESLGYTPDWYVSATTGVTITYTGMVSGARLEDGTSTDPITIPRWTQLSDEDGEIIYTTMEAITDIIPGTPGKYSVLAMQGTLNDFEINGSTKITINNLDTQNRLYFNEYNVAQNGIIISNFNDFSDYNYEQMAGTSVIENNNYEYYNKWRRVNNLNQYIAGNRVYKLGIDSVTNSVYIQFPDDIGNLINDGIYIKYILSNGEEGNIGRNDLTQIVNESGFTNDGDSAATLQTSDFVVTNTKSSQNGRDPLDIDEMKREFNRVVGVFDTLVTLRDYENYIYEYEDNNGDHVVSNIRVSDRFNDLTSSITYKNMNTSGEILDLSEVLKFEGEGSLNGRDRMTAYDIKLYPLLPVNPIETKNDLDTTFETPETLTNIEEVISNAKCISHDFATDINGNTDIGKPILIPYDLDGQIYLQTAVSEEEASEISSKIQAALLQTLNSRELTWGSAIDYGTLVDTIKNADNRIQYVALDAITYKDPETLPTNDYDIIKRNILIGNDSWTEYSNFLYDYNEESPDIKGPGEIISGGSGGENKTITGISSIGTHINISNTPASPNAYVVNTNETLTILIPQYNTVTTYSNYLYFIAKGTADNIPAATPFALKDNQYIYIFETRDAAQNFLNGYNTNLASYILGPGTIINSSVDIEVVDSPNEYENMGSSVTIDILEIASGILRTSDNIASNTNSSMGLRIATNSQGLATALNSSDSTPYTLLADEYLFYTDDLSIELGIISEGTTIYIEGATLPDITLLSTDNVEDVLNGSTLTNSNVWKQVTNQNTKIHYELNELYTFGSNYIIRFMHREDGTSESDTALSVSVEDVLTKAVNSFTDLKATNNTNVDLIKYAQLNEDGSLPEDNAWNELSRTLGDEPYKILIRMSLITGYGLPQEIKSSVNTSAITDSNISIANTNQQLNITCITANAVDNQTTTIYINGGNTVQTTRLLSYQGGNPLNLIGSEQNVSFYSYIANTPAITYGDDGFIDVVSMNNSLTLNIPGVANSTSIIPYITTDAVSTVQYAIAKAGANCISIVAGSPTLATIKINDTSSIANISKLGRPYVTNVNATYYVGTNDTTEATTISIIGDGNVAAKLSDEYTYINGYCPIYRPTSENMITDPMAPNSYFLSQHPYNRYVLPKLNNINISISPLSITR